jgi:hypothetical protein
MRMAISRVRSAVRAANRLPKLAQTASSTIPASPSTQAENRVPVRRKSQCGIHDYIRAISDRPKRAAECDEAIQLAETEWKEVWRERPVSDAEELRSIYSRKREILDLINEHTKLSTSLADAEELLRTGKEERERLEGELSQLSEPPDPAALIATIEHAKSLGDTDSAVARLKSDVTRLDWMAQSRERENDLRVLQERTLASVPTPRQHRPP